MLKKEKRGKEKGDLQYIENLSFRERTSYFSLDLHAIRPSEVFGTRRRTALCREGFAWVPDFGSFLKLREVGVSPYLGFIHSFKYFANV